MMEVTKFFKKDPLDLGEEKTAQVSFRLLRCRVTVTSIRLLHDNQSAHFRATSFPFFMIVTIQTGKVNIST